MPKIDKPSPGEIFVKSICNLMKGIESPMVIGTSCPHKTLWNSYNADEVWSNQFVVHHPKMRKYVIL